MASPEGTLTYEEFVCCARELVVLSDRLGDGWELRNILTTDSTETVFLVKRHSHYLTEPQQELVSKASGDESKQSIGVLVEEESGIEECSDPAIAASGTLLTVHFEYHIVHSVSYEVPVLYFIATYDNGKQLPLKEVWRHLLTRTYISGDTDKWGLVTQIEHPIFGRPYYHIHPCHTAKVMATALSCAVEEMGSCEQRGNYLFTWLSTFGPLVGLMLPLEYAKQLV